MTSSFTNPVLAARFLRLVREVGGPGTPCFCSFIFLHFLFFVYF